MFSASRALCDQKLRTHAHAHTLLSTKQSILQNREAHGRVHSRAKLGQVPFVEVRLLYLTLTNANGRRAGYVHCSGWSPCLPSLMREHI